MAFFAQENALKCLDVSKRYINQSILVLRDGMKAEVEARYGRDEF
jgi:hypothetical protein